MGFLGDARFSSIILLWYYPGMTPEQTKILSLRLPLELHERLVKAAAENHRSLNSEIVYRLSRSDGKEKE